MGKHWGTGWGHQQRTEPGVADPPVASAAAEAQTTSVALEVLEADTSPSAQQARHTTSSDEPRQLETPSYLRPTAASVNRCTLPHYVLCLPLYLCRHDAPLPARLYKLAACSSNRHRHTAATYRRAKDRQEAHRRKMKATPERVRWRPPDHERESVRQSTPSRPRVVAARLPRTKIEPHSDEQPAVHSLGAPAGNGRSTEAVGARLALAKREGRRVGTVDHYVTWPRPSSLRRSSS